MRKEIISINPATTEELARIPETSSDEILRMVGRLKTRFLGWRETPLEERMKIVSRVGKIMSEESKSFSELVVKEMGKIFREAKAEVDDSAGRLTYFAESAPKSLEPWKVNLPEIKAVTRFQPMGVVAAIKPWNFPVSIPLWSIAPALLAGNTVLFKPSERTPLIGKAIFEIFEKAGLPKGVMEIAYGAEETGKAIVASDCDMIAFVGSQAVGKYIMKNSADKLRKLALELGGKDPMIVCDDCDFEYTVAGAVAGTFKNCGQVCCSSERIYVDKNIFERFSEAVVEKTKRLRVGEGMDPESDIGPMNRMEELERVERHLKDAFSKGAKILCGGKRIERKGNYFEPTVVTNVTNDMLLLKEEIFGPVMVLMSYDGVGDAITKANGTPFGLTASVWSVDIKKAEKIAQRLEAGSIGINQTVSSHAECPWGGVKQSGTGRMLGPEAVREFTETVNYRHPA